MYKTYEVNVSIVPAHFSSPRTHARGHGMHTLDLQSQEEAERKRQKMLEHQETHNNKILGPFMHGIKTP